MQGSGWYHCCSAQQLTFRYVDEANHYMVQPHSDGTVSLFKSVAGSYSLVHSHSIGQAAVVRRRPVRSRGPGEHDLRVQG